MSMSLEKEPDIYTNVDNKIREIEDELKHLGRWQTKPLPPEKFHNMGAFGMRTMAIEQWIQFVLIPRVKDIIANKEPFPISQFAVYATRNLDGDHDATNLLKLICEFDALVNGKS